MAVFGRRVYEKFLVSCRELRHLLQESTERLAEIIGELLMFDSFPEFATCLAH